MRVIDRARSLVCSGPVKGATLVLVLGALPAGLALGTAEGQAPRHAAAASAEAMSLTGTVMNAGKPQRRIRVRLYRAGTGSRSAPLLLGRSMTRSDGSFSITYPAQRGAAVLYVLAGRAPVRLASALGAAPIPRHVIVNERTTVAAGFALAEFVGARGISGKAPGPLNGAGIAADLVDPRTGGLSAVLRTPPNGAETSTLAEFNTLANLLVPCTRSADRCRTLFRLATPAGGAPPEGVLAAVADIARNPGHNAAQLFALASSGRAPYQPALTASQRPDAWTLALRFVGNGRSMNGPGNMAIDARGNVWVTDNYTYSPNPLAPVCGGKVLLKFTPTGRYVQGSPYDGGGLDGAGFGITLDPRGHVWVGNFGFASTNCPRQPAHKSVSEFSSSGKPLSPSQTGSSPGGFTQGGVSWPQGTVSDKRGSIWIANCGNSSVTRYAGGQPSSARQLTGLGIQKPFDIAFNARGQAFVTGNGSSSVAALNPDGRPALPAPITGGGLSKPLGIAADTHGDMWVSNSAAIDLPCPASNDTQHSNVPSVTLIRSNGKVAPGSPFTGGGLTIPWGIAVDGNNNVWVANFAGQRLSEFCGTNASRCPHGTRTGQPISPPSGFGFDGLTRNTGVQVDPSGNLWVANNWKNQPLPQKNPGGYEMVVYIGLAGPLRTPLIGPPRPL